MLNVKESELTTREKGEMSVTNNKRELERVRIQRENI